MIRKLLCLLGLSTHSQAAPSSSGTALVSGCCFDSWWSEYMAKQGQQIPGVIDDDKPTEQDVHVLSCGAAPSVYKAVVPLRDPEWN